MKHSPPPLQAQHNQIHDPYDPLKLLNVGETHRLLGISRRGLYNLLESGCLAHIKLGRRTMFRRCDITQFIRSRICGAQERAP